MRDMYIYLLNMKTIINKFFNQSREILNIVEFILSEQEKALMEDSLKNAPKLAKENTLLLKTHKIFRKKLFNYWKAL